MYTFYIVHRIWVNLKIKYLLMKSKVTRSGDFSPISWEVGNFRQFFFNSRCSANFRLLSPKVHVTYVLILTKNGLDSIWDNFFTGSSGYSDEGVICLILVEDVDGAVVHGCPHGRLDPAKGFCNLRNESLITFLSKIIFQLTVLGMI
jgi:hypothetical protein